MRTLGIIIVVVVIAVLLMAYANRTIVKPARAERRRKQSIKREALLLADNERLDELLSNINPPKRENVRRHPR